MIGRVFTVGLTSFSLHWQFALGDLCLLASLKATPPRMDGEWSVGVANRSLLEKWHTAACKRLCLVG